MDEDIHDKFDEIHEILTRIEVGGATTQERVNGMRMHVRIGHALLFAILAGSGLSIFYF